MATYCEIGIGWCDPPHPGGPSVVSDSDYERRQGVGHFWWAVEMSQLWSGQTWGQEQEPGRRGQEPGRQGPEPGRQGQEPGTWGREEEQARGKRPTRRQTRMQSIPRFAFGYPPAYLRGWSVSLALTTNLCRRHRPWERAARRGWWESQNGWWEGAQVRVACGRERVGVGRRCGCGPEMFRVHQRTG